MIFHRLFMQNIGKNCGTNCGKNAVKVRLKIVLETSSSYSILVKENTLRSTFKDYKQHIQ